jgi:hypothetical protein
MVNPKFQLSPEFGICFTICLGFIASYLYFCHPFKKGQPDGEVDEWLKSVVC